MKEKIKLYYIDVVKGRRRGAPEALFCFVLLLLSFVYGFFVKLILFCYQNGILKSTKPNCRVISVGNISWGGTGKTPVVQTIARFLKQQGKNPAILIRGYGRDETYMLKDKFKDLAVLAGKNRLKSARQALGRYGADTVILDDGFQHWRMQRDLDIVLINAANPFGNRRLIPRGILREPLSSLERADLFVLTKSDQAGENVQLIKQELSRHNPRAAIYQAIHQPSLLRNIASGEKVELEAIKGEQVALISGIAEPQSFARTVDSLGANIRLKFEFADHHQYAREDLERIETACLKQQIETVLTTEKDAVKLDGLLRSKNLKIRMLALEIEIKIKDQESLFAQISGYKNNGSCSVLILSDGRAGHLNQSKAIAGIIQKKKQAEIKIAEVEFKNGFLRTLLGVCSIFANQGCSHCLGCLRFCLKKDCFNKLTQSKADIIVSCGSSLSSVNLFLSYKNKARNIILMKPSFLNPNRFNLVIVPEHDRINRRENVLETRVAPNLIDEIYLKQKADALSQRLGIQGPAETVTGGPTIGVLVGGDTPKHKLSLELMQEIIPRLKDAAKELNCRILLSTSRRTSGEVEQFLKESLGGFKHCKLLVIANEKNIPEAVGGILGLSDIILVSGESVSMVSEAVSAQKPTLVFKPQKKANLQTKQDRFLENLEKQALIKVIQEDNLLSEITKISKEKPKTAQNQDRQKIDQALSRMLG